MIARLLGWLGQWLAPRVLPPRRPTPDDDIAAYI